MICNKHHQLVDDFFHIFASLVSMCSVKDEECSWHNRTACSVQYKISLALLLLSHRHYSFIVI